MRRIILLVFCMIIVLPACGRRGAPEEREDASKQIETDVVAADKTAEQENEIAVTEETPEPETGAPAKVYSVDELTTASSPYSYSDAERWGFSEELTQELYAMRQKEAEIYRKNKAVYSHLTLLEPQAYFAVREDYTCEALVYTYNDLKVEFGLYRSEDPQNGEIQIVRGEEVLKLTWGIPAFEHHFLYLNDSDPNPLIFLKDMTGDGNCELVIYWNAAKFQNGIRIVDLVEFKEIPIEGIRGLEAEQEKAALQEALLEVFAANALEPWENIFRSDAGQILAYLDYSCDHLCIEVRANFVNSGDGKSSGAASIEYEYDSESGSFKPGSNRRVVMDAQNYYQYGAGDGFSSLIYKKVFPFLEKNDKPWYALSFFHPDTREYAVILMHGAKIEGGFIVVDEVEQTVLTLSVRQCEEIRDSAEYRFMVAYRLVEG